MTKAQALRILGLEPPVDEAAVRDAFSMQMRRFREARAGADARERARLDRALELTLVARDVLLPGERQAFSVTQELPRIAWRQYGPHAWIILGLGLVMVLIGLLPDDPGPSTAAVTTGAAAESTAPSALLGVPRSPLADRWARQGNWLVPEQTRLDGVELPAAPVGWRWQPQRDGSYALVAENGSDWVLAAPLIVDGVLRWACFSRRGDHEGCFAFGNDAILDRRVPLGRVGARQVAEALDRLPEQRLGGTFTARRWYRQAVELLEARRARGRT